MTAAKRTALALRLKVSLQEVEPEIWRLLLVRESMTLARLHGLIQRAMGWTRSHLYQFEIHGQAFTDLETWEPFDDEDVEPGDPDLTRLADFHFKQGAAFTYLYDFGDYWMHDVVVQEILPVPQGQRLPQCLAGARACPPEDCGGPAGYFQLLEALYDPGHSEHESYREWLGGRFDPEAFSLHRANGRR